MIQIPSKIIQDVIEKFAILPGIGRKTALRLTLYLLNQKPEQIEAFAKKLMQMAQDVRFCIKCHNLSVDQQEHCNICADRSRNHKQICVVENLKDIVQIEHAASYKGLYHVLGGIISPLDGIAPSALNIETLIRRIETEAIDELIFALPTTLEGDTTCFYLHKKTKSFEHLKTSTLARGISLGDDLEYTDSKTLARSIIDRIPFQSNQSI